MTTEGRAALSPDAPGSGTVSIAMATYNGARFIREQLESLASQTRRPDELVVTDDASTDATVAIVTDFGATAPFPVRIHVNQSRLGYRANFMSAMALCTSDYVALCDQDDVWEPTKLEIAVSAFANPEVVLFFHGASLIDAGGVSLGTANIYSLPAISPPGSFYPLGNPYGFSMVFRRELVRYSSHWTKSVDNLEAANRMAHDQWIFFLASVFGTIVYADQHLVRYRQHGGNAYGWQDWRNLKQRLLARFTDNGPVHGQFARAAKTRAAILRDIAAEASEPAQVTRCAGYYEELSAKLNLRSDVYQARRFHQRARAVIRLAATGGYNRRAMWNIGPRAIVKDVGLGLLLRPLMRPAEGAPQAVSQLRSDPKSV